MWNSSFKMTVRERLALDCRLATIIIMVITQDGHGLLCCRKNSFNTQLQTINVQFNRVQMRGKREKGWSNKHSQAGCQMGILDVKMTFS